MRNIVSPFDGIRSPFGNRASVAALSAYAVLGNEPQLVFDSSAGFYRKAGADTTFAELVTFARASEATYVDSSGVLQTAASGVARTDHHRWNGSAWVKVGRLESEARTNIETQSVSLSNYVSSSGAGATITTGQADPFGGTNAGLYERTTTGSNYKFGTITIATKLFSCWLKAGTVSTARIQVGASAAVSGVYADVNLSAGTIGSATAVGSKFSVGAAPTIEPFPGGWYRCSVEAINETSCVGYIIIPGAGVSGDNILFYGPQLELGSVPSSYIPTAGSTVTRAAETLTIAGADMPYSATAMSFAVQGEMDYADTDAAALVTFFRQFNSSTNNLGVTISGTTSRTGQPIWSVRSPLTTAYNNAGPVNQYTPGIGVPYNLASRVLAGGSPMINLAYEGTPNTASGGSSVMPSVSATPLQLGYIYMGSMPKLRAWNIDLTDAGIVEAST